MALVPVHICTLAGRPRPHQDQAKGGLPALLQEIPRLFLSSTTHRPQDLRGFPSVTFAIS